MRAATGDVRSTIGLIVGGVLLLMLLAGVYKLGARSEEKPSAVLHATAHQREKALRDLIATCQHRNNLNHIREDQVDPVSRPHVQANKRLKLQNDDLYRSVEKAEADLAVCHSTGIQERALRSEFDAVLAADIRELENAVKYGMSFLAAATDVNNGGMRHVLLRQTIRRARMENLRLRSHLGIAAPTSITEYENELIEKWREAIATKGALTDGNVIGNVTAEEIAAAINQTWGDAPPFVFDRAVHRNIFLPTDPTARPAWFGRTGSPPPVVGTAGTFGRSKIRTATLADLLKGVQEVAACAYRNNNPNFTFQDVFYRAPRRTSDDDPKVAASALIDTPLLAFCRDCRAMERTNLFRLACLGDTRGATYGTFDFWTMRSLVRFHPDVLAAARDYSQQQALQGGKYLSVLFKHSARLRARCHHALTAARLPRRIFLWAKGNFPNRTIPQISPGDTMEQCVPSVGTLQAAIRQKVAEKGYTAVYISFDAGTPSAPANTSTVFAGLDVGAGVKVVFGAPNNPTDDAVDMIVSSQGAEIIANAYSAHSEIVTEMFLLRHELRIDGVTFF